MTTMQFVAIYLGMFGIACFADRRVDYGAYGGFCMVASAAFATYAVLQRALFP